MENIYEPSAMKFNCCWWSHHDKLLRFTSIFLNNWSAFSGSVASTGFKKHIGERLSQWNAMLLILKPKITTTRMQKSYEITKLKYLRGNNSSYSDFFSFFLKIVSAKCKPCVKICSKVLSQTKKGFKNIELFWKDWRNLKNDVLSESIGWLIHFNVLSTRPGLFYA